MCRTALDALPPARRPQTDGHARGGRGPTHRGHLSVDKTVEDALRKILAQKDAIAALDSQKDERNEEMTKIFDDQQRLRENMKALKGSAEEKALLQRYTQQLNEQETRIETLRKEVAQFSQQSDSAQEALDKMTAALAFDVKL
jgi:chromosome segregation ATPase